MHPGPSATATRRPPPSPGRTPPAARSRRTRRLPDGPPAFRLFLCGREIPAAGTLGNLTLTAFNPEMGNKPFRDKRDAEKGYRDSPLRLNADLRQTDRWDGDAIRAPRRASR